MRVRLSHAALRDLTQAIESIAADNPDATGRLRDRLVVAAEQLVEFPRMGGVDRRGRRIFSVPGTAFRLLYDPRGTTIFILRILHGARQWPPARD